MKDIIKIKLLENAIEKNGKNFQLDLLIEECSELIHSISKFKRDVSVITISNICEEIADVEIMLSTVKLCLNKDKLIDLIKDKKFRRLRNILK